MRYYCFSLGCKVNSYEISSIKAMLEDEGYVEDCLNPDVVIINTCSVTATADQKSRQHIRKFKNMFSGAILVVMGCYSQGNSNYILENTEAEIIIGTKYRSKIPSLIKTYLKTKERICLVDPFNENRQYEEMSNHSAFSNVRCYLKIQDGCNNYCTYCLIPYRRGVSRSRKVEDILSEVHHIVNLGYKEIILTGIHIGAYGEDLVPQVKFSTLVDLISSIEGVKRLTISSLEASEIDDELIHLIKTRKNIAPHLHIPLQSGSEEILRKMNRKYTKFEFLDKIKKIRKNLENIMIATDVIVGFPGESEANFLETIDFIKECGFNFLHVFPFSSRNGTVASKMKDQIKSEIKQERVYRLLTLSSELHEQYLKKNNHKKLSVLVESYNEKDNTVSGLSENYISCSFKGTKDDVNSFMEYEFIYK